MTGLKKPLRLGPLRLTALKNKKRSYTDFL
jgi:hypothetical protein